MSSSSAPLPKGLAESLVTLAEARSKLERA